MKAMGAGGMSKSQVSRLCGEIDERVNAFLSRPIEPAYSRERGLPLARCDLREGARGRRSGMPSLPGLPRRSASPHPSGLTSSGFSPIMACAV